MATILVVDDRPMNRDFLVTLLGYYGHTLDDAADGVEALAKVRERRPDLVITDLLMPNMDGEEFIRRLRADPGTKDLPAIIYTATYRAREARAIADRVGVRIVLAKPAEPQAIVAAVAEALGEATPAAQAVSVPSAARPEMVALGRGVAGQLDSVQSINHRLTHLLANAVRLAEDQAKSLTQVRELEGALQNVQTLGLRLTGLVELGLEMASARDPGELVKLFCRALQDILSSRQAGVVVMGGHGDQLRHYFGRGLEPGAGERVAREIAECALAKKFRGAGDGNRIVIGVKRGDETGLPASHPPVDHFLACPITAHAKPIGWLYVANRLGKGSFSTDDERVAMALGAQFATAWDSLALYGDLESLVAQRTRQLEASNRELESFSYSVSHDLRAPLRAIDGFTRLVIDDHAANLAPEGLRLLNVVRDQTRKMSALIDDLLELARVGRRELGLNPVKLDELVRNCWSELPVAEAGRKVELVVGELPVWNGDRILLKQLFVNLLSNALKYTRKQAAARVEVGAERRGAEQVVFVRDNGAGFDMALAQKLFGVFQRMHAQEDYPGTGVGLAIVRRVAERHGARVWAEAILDHGATFYVAFPLAPAVA